MNLRRLLRYSGILVVAAAVYDGVVFYSRWSSDRAIEQARAAQEAEQARKTLALLGGEGLKIVNFYASPGAIPQGGTANICYGVNGAKVVKLDPPVEEVHAALTHCLQVAPAKDTEYTLTAEDGAGHSVSQSLAITVAK
jgi:hypothetical protein